MTKGPLPMASGTKPIIFAEDDWNEACKHAWEKTAAYIIRKNGSYYEAIKGGSALLAGTIVYGGSGDAGGVDGTVLEDVFNATEVAAGGDHIHFKAMAGSLTDECVVTNAKTWVTGSGKATKLTQATANKACFSITTKADVRLSNMWLYGTGAGTGSGVYATTTCTNLQLDGIICENHGYYGAHIINSDYINLRNNRFDSNIYNGVLLDTVDYSGIVDNHIKTNTRHGFALDDCNYNLVSLNTIIGNDSADAATYDGVNISQSAATSYYNRVINNVINGNDRYEVYVGAGCTENSVVPNSWVTASDHEKIVNDLGTKTIFHVHPLTFGAGGDLDGTNLWANYISATASAKGWEIDDAADFATAVGQLPLDLSEVVRFKIWGVALGAPLGAGGQMHLAVNMNAGAANLAYTTEPVALTDVDGEEADYIATDVVSWIVDSGDDADIGSMVGGMSLEVEAVYNTGAAPDGASNVVLRNVEIEYV